jgi:PilZ domain
VNLTDAMLDVLNVVKLPVLANGAPPAQPASWEAMFKSAPDLGSEPPSALAMNIAERRSKVRYPIELEVRFFASKGRSRTYSIGRTVNISSSGLLVASAGLVHAGTDLHVMIQWPFALDGRIPLQLAAAGIVVRSSASNFAVQVRSYQFRTMKQQVLLQQARAFR